MAHKKFYDFLGVRVDAITYDEMETYIDGWIADKTTRSHHIACINAYCVTLAKGDQNLRDIYNSADIRGADGMPFVKWIRRFLRVKCDRFSAPNVIDEIAKRAEAKGYTFYLYGGAPEVLENMYEYMIAKYPYLKIVGRMSPPFRDLSEQESEEIVAEINQLQPDIIAVGLGTPKQDYWIRDNKHRIKGSVLIASGATFDFYGGRIKMAPKYIQESGFEWLYRLFSKDFFRLFHRYTTLNIVFLWNFFLQLTRVRKFPINSQSR